MFGANHWERVTSVLKTHLYILIYINVHVHHSNFQIVPENYTMEKIYLLAILCACMAHNLAQTKIDFFLFLRNGRYQTRQLMRFDHIFWSENRDIWW